MQTYLVTGGSGFIGSHLVAALLQRGERVRVFDNVSTGNLRNIEPFLNDIEYRKGDVRDPEAVRAAVAGVNVVFHQAAIPSVPRSLADPLETNEVNVTGTLHVLQAARDSGVQRLVFASTCALYGDGPVLPKVETMLDEPLSPYAVSKQAAERYCEVWARVYGLPTIALRYFNVFGPRQDPNSDYAAVIPRFITKMLRGEPPTIYGDGLQSRDFIYIDGIVAANLMAASAPASVNGHFNVATGESYSLLDVVARLNRLLGSELVPIHTDARAGEVRHSQANIERIGEALGWEPPVTFDEGLQRTVEAFREV